MSLPKPAEIRKALIAVAGAAAQAAEVGFLPGNVAKIVGGVLTVAIAGLAVYTVPNDPAPAGKHEAPDPGA